MSTKSILVLCVNALFIQVISGACWGNAAGSFGWGGEGLGWAGPGLGIEAAPCAGPAPFLGAGWAAYGPSAVAASNGGGLVVSSASPIPPVGVSVASDNAVEGILEVGGELPLLGTVGLEGALPSAGAGGVTYGCGNGAVGIVTEGIVPTTAGLPVGLGYGPGWNGALSWAGRGIGLNGCGSGPL